MAPLQEEGVARLGTMGFAYRFWIDKLYPEGTKPEDYLKEYAKRLVTVEIDATFYRLPSISTVETWRDAVPEDFRFAAKFPQVVTHVPGLVYDTDRLAVFLDRMALMGDKLGPLLLQFPPQLKPDHAAFTRLLDALPPGYLYAAEFRNKGWFTEETYELLRKRKVALATTNRLGAPDIPTAGFSYFRWEGDRKAVNGQRGEVEVDRSDEAATWAERILAQLQAGRDIYGYFSKYYSGYPPADVEAFTRLLSTTRGTGRRHAGP